MFKPKKLNICTQYCFRGVGPKIVELLAKEGLTYTTRIYGDEYDIQVRIEDELDLDNVLMLLRDEDYYGVTVQWL